METVTPSRHPGAATTKRGRRDALILLQVVLIGATLSYGTQAYGARGGDCGKVDAWLEIISEWSMGRDLNTIRSEQLRDLLAPGFHQQVMTSIWGSEYASMSVRKRASVKSALSKCSREPWVTTFLSIPFSDPPDAIKRAPHTDYSRWQAAITAVNQHPYAALQAKRQQKIDAGNRAVQARAEAEKAAQANRQRVAELKQEYARQEQARTEQRIALVNQHSDSGPFRGNGASYLNALYVNDRQALRAYDEMFSLAYSEAFAELYKGSATDVISKLFYGDARAQDLTREVQESMKRMSMIVGVASVFILNYEHAYPNCMDSTPIEYEQSTRYEWVTKNIFGDVLWRSPGMNITEHYKINNRFKDVFIQIGVEHYLFTTVSDSLFGYPGAIRFNDVMNATSRSMRTFACDSDEILKLEKNVMAYFWDAVRRMNAARGK